MWRDDFSKLGIGANRRAQNDEVRPLHRLSRLERVEIAQTQRARLVQRFLLARRDRDRLDQTVTACCQRDRRSDQTNADQRQLFKLRSHHAPLKALSTFATARIASSEPMEMRMPFQIS